MNATLGWLTPVASALLVFPLLLVAPAVRASSLITGYGGLAAPHVKAFDGIDLDLLHSFFTYSPTFTGGVYVAGIPAIPIPEPAAWISTLAAVVLIATRQIRQREA